MAIEGYELLERMGQGVKCDIRFGRLANLHAFVFFATMTVGALATFNLTDYSPDTDKITKFYDTFNPCIFFDHYPAKAFATIGLGLLILLGVTFSLVMMLFHFAGKQLFTMASAGLVAAFAILVDCLFVNVMVTNLYPLEQPYRRRLHGVHHMEDGIVTLAEDSDGDTLSQSDIQIILLHTFFYVLWVVYQFIYCIYLTNTAYNARVWTKQCAILWAALIPLSLFYMLVHGGSMLIVISRGKIVVFLEDDLSEFNSLQHWVLHLNHYFWGTLFGFLPIFFYRHVLGSSLGVRFFFHMASGPIEGNVVVQTNGEMSPNRFIAGAFYIFAIIALAAGLYQSAENISELNDSVKLLKITGMMRSKPFAYFATPAWLFGVVLACVGCWMTIIQRRLVLGHWPMLEIFLAAPLATSTYCGMLLFLERERFTWIFGLLFMLSFIGWVLVLSMVRKQHPCIIVVYVLTGIMLIAGSVLESAECSLGFVFWMCLYEFCVPAGPKLQVTLARLGEEDQKDDEEDEEDDEEENEDQFEDAEDGDGDEDDRSVLCIK